MQRVLIAGCGDIGCALGERLLADGHAVWGLRRSAAALPAGMERLTIDLTSPAELEGLPPNMDTVFYIVTPDARDDGSYESAFVHGVRNLRDALSSGDGPPRRLVFVSSTSVYAQSDGEWVDEDSPTEPRTFPGRRLLQGERLVLDGPIPGVVVRFGGIYGRGEGRLVERVRRGEPCQESPPLFTNRVHRDDCVSVLQHVFGLGHPDGIYVAVDNDPAPQCAVMDWLAARMGLPSPPRVSSEAAGGGSRESGKRCRNARLLASGYRLIYPTYREGYGALIGD